MATVPELTPRKARKSVRPEATTDTLTTTDPGSHDTPPVDTLDVSKEPDLKEEPQQPSKAEPETVWRLNWYAVVWIGLLHVGALAAPFTFTWQALVLVVVLHWMTGGLGICLGYHRMLTHSSFSTYRPVRWLISLIGDLAGEGPPIDWVADHRKHHAHSDQKGDPHSPHDGPWWSHMFWMTWTRPKADHEAHLKRWAPDLLKDPDIRFLGAMFLPLQFLAGTVLGLFGYWLGGTSMAVSFVVWGVFVRLVLVLHTTWFVNSASHIWGYRNYPTTDDSRNNWWVALLTYGEGWHNNHHAYPRMAKHGHRWWEFDMTFLTIRLLQKLGLVWDVVDYRHKNEVTQAD